MEGLSFIISSIGKSPRLDDLIAQIDSMFSNKEIILIDNSKDKILFNKYSNNKKCRYFYEKNQGSSYARNRGGKEAKNQMLVFLDDDVILSKKFKNLDFMSLYFDSKFGIASGKVIVNNAPEYLPKKYRYLSGEKDYGNTTTNLRRCQYLGGCLLIIKKSIFDKLGGFDINFGHTGNIIGANEDVIIQEKVRKLGLNVVYIPQATVFHFWNEDESKAIERVKIQGLADKMMDERYFKLRKILKCIKFKIFILLNKNNKKLSKEKLYDLERYKSYVKNYRV